MGQSTSTGLPLLLTQPRHPMVQLRSHPLVQLPLHLQQVLVQAQAWKPGGETAASGAMAAQAQRQRIGSEKSRAPLPQPRHA